MIKRISLLLATLLICSSYANLLAQIENVPVVHPVYKFLEMMHKKGYLENTSLFCLPFSRNEIVTCLKQIRSKDTLLSEMEREILLHYEKEFFIVPNSKSVLIPSETDTVQVLFKRFFSNDEKFIYHFQNDDNSVSVVPLGSIFLLKQFSNDSNPHAFFANAGFRVYGSINNILGYYLQITNGKFIGGSKDFGIREEKYLSHSVKFTLLNSDFDLTESHIRLEKDWFFAGISRETRFIGSGISQNLVVSDNAPPMDEFYLGVKFKNFRYTFSNFSLIAKSLNQFQTSVNSNIPPKYLVMHSASFIFKNWNLTYFETMIYSGRSVEIAYLNPFSFLKSLEHSLHDRDKVSMGFSFEFNPFNCFQLSGTWMMEDMVFSKIGKGFWGNKTAWNIGFTYSLKYPIDFGFEYTRVEPYMFTHFNNINNRTNDGRLIGTYLLPNSDEFALVSNFWFGRYPLTLKMAFVRHGDNVYDSDGNLIKNVGGDFEVNFNKASSETVTFLDGIRNDYLKFDISWGFEIFKNLNLYLSFSLRKPQKSNVQNVFKIRILSYDF